MDERTQLLVNVVDEKGNRLIGYYILEVNITICQNRNDKFIHEWGGDVGNYARNTSLHLSTCWCIVRSKF